LIFEISVVVQGADGPMGCVTVRVTSHPIGVKLLLPAITGKALPDVRDTFCMRDAAGNDFAGYVAVIVATAPADAGHPHAAHALAPEYRPTTVPPVAVVVKSKSAKVTSAPSAFLTRVPLTSVMRRVTGVQVEL